MYCNYAVPVRPYDTDRDSKADNGAFIEKKRFFEYGALSKPFKSYCSSHEKKEKYIKVRF
jgi:hypothetical protein